MRTLCEHDVNRNIYKLKSCAIHRDKFNMEDGRGYRDAS